MAGYQRLTPGEMEKNKEGASVALKAIPIDAINAIARWWKQWYLTVGHKRLGRLLLTYVKNEKTKYDVKENNPFQEIKASIASSGLIYTFSEAPQDTTAMFSVEYQGAEIRIILNTLHPGYPFFRGVIHISDEREKYRINDDYIEAIEGIKLLFAAWAKYECEQPHTILYNRIKETRLDWGRVSLEQMREKGPIYDGNDR